MANSPNPRIKPPALRPGDTVGIVAPGSPIKRDLLLAGCEGLRRLGYKPLYNDSILDRDLYFAGSVTRRARELEEMFERDDVRAIICARGGYGTNYLLEELDLAKLKRHPKIFVGYSDVTTLLTWFTNAAGLVTFHGPMVTKDLAAPRGLHLASWNAALTAASAWELNFPPGSEVKVLLEGSAEGTLYGGCLSMLAASLGTPFEIATRDTILFMEDVAAKPFQVDRMLMQLKLAGKLETVRGIVFGEMLDCAQPGVEQDYTLEEVVTRVLRDLNIPIAYGLRSGHVTRENITLPLGVRCSLEAKKNGVRLRLLESSVAPAGEVVRSANL
ncbi:MAG TPA: LD-carboxypeptidase [Terriglobales bacterium]|nr:LD-carboxypeptidase [Terriglobales bacterium]